MVLGFATDSTLVFFDERVATSTADVHPRGPNENLTLQNIIFALGGLFCFLLTDTSTICWCKKLLVKGGVVISRCTSHPSFLILVYKQPFATHFCAFLRFF